MVGFFLVLGIICIFISGSSIGAWTNGDRQRANFYTETAENRHLKTNIAMIFALVGIVALIIAGFIYFR